ncbi:MAG TPA: 2-oxoacid:acceptor oxidoreductase family protein [Bryobacteraceae bacterium]|jgi:pyruvate ferredoxin oxidoreductase gamma subunit
MFQIRIHGRGGQGVVTAAELLSLAGFLEGKHAQAFPSFGSERMGAPVMAFCRIDEKTIRLREPVMRPDALIVQDPTLLHQVDLFDGLSLQGYVLLNSTRSFHELGLDEFVAKFPEGHCCTVPASELAMQHVGRPLPNAALLGGFAAIAGLLKIESVESAIGSRFAAKIAGGNIAAARAAYDSVRSANAEVLHA